MSYRDRDDAAAVASVIMESVERGMSLPSTFTVRFGTDDQDEWPLEATLLVAAYRGNIHRLKEIATRLDTARMGVVSTLRRTSFGGLNVLHAATGGKGLLPMCRYLVEEVRMDVNRRDTAIGKGMTPLQHAASAGNLPTMRYLLDWVPMSIEQVM